MKKITTIRCLLTLAIAALLAPGCAAPDVNPPQARPNTGYVDFQADPPDELCWEVSRFDERSQKYRRVFSELKPPQGGVLRLAFAPGRHRLQITFLNRLVAGPADVEVEIQDGRITPVRVTLTDVASATVQRKELAWGNTAKGLYGRRTRTDGSETIMYKLSTQVEKPVGYQSKEQTPQRDDTTLKPQPPQP